MTRWRSYVARRVEGFSLIEVLVALVLVTTGVIGLAHVFAIAAASGGRALDVTRATVLAVQKIEELRSIPFPAVTSQGEESVSGYRRRWTATPLSDGLLVVTVDVRRSTGPFARLHTLRAQHDGRRPE
jgi:prepilin-type N-terminal cleavage/methylation domain-containing protein